MVGHLKAQPLRQKTGEHLKRLEGRVETIAQNSEAAMVMMGSKTFDLIPIALERGQLWEQAIQRFEAGERGVDAREALDKLSSRLPLEG